MSRVYNYVCPTWFRYLGTPLPVTFLFAVYCLQFNSEQTETSRIFLSNPLFVNILHSD